MSRDSEDASTSASLLSMETGRGRDGRFSGSGVVTFTKTQFIFLVITLLSTGVLLSATWRSYWATSHMTAHAGHCPAPVVCPACPTVAAARAAKHDKSADATAAAGCPEIFCPACPLCPKGGSGPATATSAGGAATCPPAPACPALPPPVVCPVAECPEPAPCPDPPVRPDSPHCELWQCKNGGWCNMDAATNKTQHCVCPFGTSGDQCELDGRHPNACSGCNNGFEMRDGRCVDRNECQNRNGGCDVMKPCINTPGSFHCGACPSGMEGDPCTFGPCLDRRKLMELTPSVTFVTALYETKRTDRDFKYYLEKLYKVLNVPVPLVLFAPEHVIAWANDMRFNHSHPRARATPFLGIPYAREIITDSPEFAISDKIRQSPEWNAQCGWCAGGANGKRLYNEITFWKAKWMGIVSRQNPFNTSHFLWVDGGYRCTAEEDFESLTRWVPTLGQNVIVGQHFHYVTNNEIHGYARAGAAEFAQTTTIEWVMKATVWGGSASAVQLFERLNNEILWRSLERKLLGTEEALYSIIRVLRPELFRLRINTDCQPMTPCMPKGEHAPPPPPGPAPYFVPGVVSVADPNKA